MSSSPTAPARRVRSDRERRESHTFVSYFATYCYGREPWITINGFTVTNTPDYGINVSSSSFVTISNNHVSRAGFQASGMTRGGDPSTRVCRQRDGQAGDDR